MVHFGVIRIQHPTFRHSFTNWEPSSERALFGAPSSRAWGVKRDKFHPVAGIHSDPHLYRAPHLTRLRGRRIEALILTSSAVGSY